MDKADNPKVSAPTIEPARLEAYGIRPQAMSAIEYGSQRVRALGGEPPTGAGKAKLKRLFGKLACEQAMTPAEREQEGRRQAYLAEEVRRKAAGKGRECARADTAIAKKQAMVWRRDLRSILRYVAEHTRTLQGQRNEATGQLWTDVERGTEFNSLWRKAGVALILGRREDETLQLLNHPVTEIPGAEGVQRKELWKPPGDGFVGADSLTFKILDSLIQDPTWNDKFIGLIDGLMTSVNESFFHTLRKWGTKISYFPRYYAIAIWCTTLNWNENITRAVLEHEWRQGKSGQLSSSAGRSYRVPVRPPLTDNWRDDAWELCREKWLAHSNRLKPLGTA